MRTFLDYLIVFFGAGIGGAARHAVNRLPVVANATWPWGTALVNVTGSVMVGLVAGWFAFRGQAPQSARLFVTVGLLGGYTTFSAFALDSLLLWERGQHGAAALYIVGTVVLSVLGALAGMAVMRAA